MTISVKDELMTTLEASGMRSRTDTEVALKQRNIAMILAFYGFGKLVWPTLEDLAVEFELTTRERVRQIIEQKFRRRIDVSQLPAARRCAEILQGRKSWASEEYIATLSAAGIDVPQRSIKGLLNLMEDLGLNVNYRAYTPDFREMSRSLVEDGLDMVLVRDGDAKAQQAAFKLAADRPGLVGIANLRELAEERQWSDELYATIRKAVAYAPKVWSAQNGDDFWYAFEERQTTLRTYHEKVFSVIEWADPAHLAELYENALHARTANISRPPVSIIEHYLRTSLLFERQGELIRYDGPLGELTGIELATQAFLLEHDRSTYRALHDHLAAKGYSRPYIQKAAMFSCLVHVDTTQGRQNYVYRRVQSAANPGAAAAFSAYEMYRERLRRLYEDATDGDLETQRRLEQGVLKDWLFASKHEEHCAICGDLFHVSALVTAHKKKRSLCTTAERLDPYIAMPACTLGCDFLYEREYIYIVDGVVQVNATKSAGTTEYRRAAALAGRKLIDTWRAGKDEYFRKPG
ncbi:hypothetical protein BZM27_06245 [Paraburkholderia steynii]|uniref:Uncharacterized protein n=1 Tax=Paraburkholderia steynii TaxID=1245441 RepID=A0A4R0XFE8_9BURK|nr:hypothetical protein BZM27_06245 [Paraburkholderia steynii]